MGINNFSKFIKAQCGMKKDEFTKIIKVDKLKGKIMGIDCNELMHAYKHNTDNYLSTYKGLISYLVKNGILPVFFIDGPKNDFKEDTLNQRKKYRDKAIKNGTYTGPEKKDFEIIQSFFDIYDVPYVISNNIDAEFIGCNLANRSRNVVGFMSGDSDCFAHGCKRIFNRFIDYSNNELKYYRFKDILVETGYTKENFKKACVCLGTDYNGSGIKGYGPAKISSDTIESLWERKAKDVDLKAYEIFNPSGDKFDYKKYIHSTTPKKYKYIFKKDIKYIKTNIKIIRRNLKNPECKELFEELSDLID
ncbi:MAG: hypothetical protein ACOCRK_00640 [bacterium]